SALFRGKPVMLKRGVDRATAARYQKAFKGAGACLRVTAAEAQAPAKKTQAPAESPKASPQKPKAAAPGGKKSLAERLHAEEARAAAPMEQRAAAAVFGPAWDLAPAGSDLVRSEERPPQARVVVPDVSHISAAPVNSGSLEDVVAKEEPPPPPDVSAVSIAEVGADLTDPKEPAPVQVPDTSAMTLSEVGVTLVEPKQVVPLEVDVSGISVAEVGSDLIELKDEKPAAAPNTDHIELDHTT
ncbi:MAG: hypothetical protein V3U43_02755, partial [Pseudomonadales bacterium]